MFILLSLLASALASPRITVVPRSDGGYVLRNGVVPVDAWTFSVHYDRRVRQGLVGKVYGRRAMFFEGLVVGAATTMGAVIWAGTSSNSRTRSYNPAPLVLGFTGALLVGLTIPAAAVAKSRSLRPSRHWTMEEASVLAAGGRITHGMEIVPTRKGWTVINRVGRPLSAVEVAARLGEQHTLRRARRANVAANVMTQAAVAAGTFGIIGGLSMATDGGAKPDWRLTGAGAMGAGTGLIVAGIVGRLASTRQQTAQAYWTREELQVLLDIP